MKKVNKVNEKFAAAQYEYRGDNRKRTHRVLNDLLETGIVNFTICEKGKVWTPEDGFNHNLRVSIKTPENKYRLFRQKVKYGVDPYSVLQTIGQVLQNEIVKSDIKSYVNLDSSCQRCSGLGIIKQFHYYCNGICFECYGLGYDRKFKPTVEIVK